MSDLTIGSLFSGYGGLDLAVEEVFGARTVWHCENDPAAAAVLAARWPGIRNLGDITEVDWATVPPVDIITAGFPCQDVSHAGDWAGLRGGTRSGLWARAAEVIDHLLPRIVVVENVRGVLSAGADSDMEPALGVWETARVNLLCGHSELFSGTWPSSGSMRSGSVSVRPTSGPLTAGSGCSSSPGQHLATPTASISKGGRLQDSKGKRDLRLDLLPTPTASDRFGAGAHGDGGADLRTTVAALLPTPRATDGTKGGPNQRGSSGDLMLPSAVTQLLPTPTAQPYGNNQSPNPNANVRPSLSSLAPTLLPTPTAMDSRASGGGSPTDVTLTDAIVRTDLGRQPNPRHAGVTRGDSTGRPSTGGNSPLVGQLPLLPS